MVVPYHTHEFQIPTASEAEVAAGTESGKVVTPATLGSSTAFATAAQGALADTAVQPADLGVYTSRALAEAANVPAPVNKISVVSGDLLLHYERNALGTALTTADGAKWSPLGDVYPDHWAENTTPGTTDMGAAILAAQAYSSRVDFAATGYATSVTVGGNNVSLVGKKASYDAASKRTAIVGLSASLAATDPIVKIGRTTVVTGMRVYYDTLTGSETEAQRVGIWCGTPEYHLQRGSLLDDLLIYNCGTAIYADITPFSVTFGTIEIGSHSYAAIDFDPDESSGPTGNVIENIYINGADTYEAEFGVKFGGGISFGGSVGQLNVERNTYRQSPVQFINCAGLQVASLHVEGVALRNDNTDFLYIEGPQPEFGTVTVIHCGTWGENCGLVGFGETVQTSTTGVLSRDFTFSADRVEVRNPLRLNTIPSGYPTGTNDWVSRAPGWRWFTRRDFNGADPVRIDVRHWCYNVYQTWNADADEVRYYTNPWYYSERAGLWLDRLGSVGPASPVINLLSDPEAMSVAANTAIVGNSFFATDCFSSGLGAGAQVTKEANSSGVSFLIEPGSGNTYQRIEFYGLLPSWYRGGYLSCYFELEAVDGATAIEQARILAFNRSGTSQNNKLEAQITGTTAVAAGGVLPVYATINFDMSSFTWGSRPMIGLHIQINDAVVERTSKVRIRNVALAVGRVNPAHTVPAFPLIKSPA